MSQKFDSILAKHLYELDDPDEEVGSSSEGVGWAGIWSEMGVIIQEDTQGFVTTRVCTEEEVALVWADIQKALSLDSPADDDYVIDPTGGYRVVQLGLTFPTYEGALAAIAQDMAEQKFWPNVWLLSERGDFTNVSEDLPKIDG
jgi:hypothetical protein